MGKKILLVIIVLLVISAIAYTILGGFKPLSMSITENTTTHIVGKYFKGKMASDTLQDIFLQAREIVENHEEVTAIAIAYYGEVDEETGLVTNFIGFKTDGGLPSYSPEGWTLRTFEAPKSVKACIEANILVMPTPEDMQDKLRKYSAENDIKPDSIFIEYYTGPSNLCVELLSK